MIKKLSNLILLFIITSCGTLNEAGKVLRNEKVTTSDEFLVKKKDPLILPPDYENLPTPDERVAAEEENLIFKNTLETPTETESSSSDSNSVENSILKKIQSK